MTEVWKRITKKILKWYGHLMMGREEKHIVKIVDGREDDR